MNPVEIEMNFPAEHGGNVFGQFDAYMKKLQAKEENLDKKRSTVKIKKTVGTISYEESKSRSKDRSL